MENNSITDEDAVVALILEEALTLRAEAVVEDFLQKRMVSLIAGDHYYVIPASISEDGDFNAEWCFEAPTVEEARRKAREAGVSKFLLMSKSGDGMTIHC